MTVSTGATVEAIQEAAAVSAVPALVVENLSVRLGSSLVVDDVSFSIAPGETLALVGESGAGKSMTARAVMGLLPRGAQVASGRIIVHGKDVSALREREWRNVRGRDVGMVFQNPLRSLNPTMKIGKQISEALVTHDPSLSRQAARDRAVELLKQVQIPDPGRRYDEYPHQLSGGMRQRVVIAIAISCAPAVLLADEPTTALDVTTQAQILRLLRELQQSHGMAVLLVTHDIRIAEDHAHRVAVMYAGRLMEHGPVDAVINSARMPYTRALMNAVPELDATPHSLLPVIAGRPPDPREMPPGCAFEPRCSRSTSTCTVSAPPTTEAGPHSWRCWNPLEVGAGHVDAR
jgi:oligopeptide/dipeptide ABC transporter ATP-binding protein